MKSELDVQVVAEVIKEPVADDVKANADLVTKYGSATFKHPVDPKTFSEPAKLILNGQQWRMFYKEYQKNNWTQILKNITQADNEHFIVCNNENPNMLKEICHINFWNVNRLTLRKENLTNIQLLQSLQIPGVTHMFIEQNTIVNIRPFKKCNFPKLSLLQISDPNPIDLSPLTQFGGQGHEFSTIKDLSSEPKKIQAEDYTWMVKLCAKRIKCIHMDNRLVNQQKTVDTQLKQKWPHLLIYR